jgi:hypothetical protein
VSIGGPRDVYRRVADLQSLQRNPEDNAIFGAIYFAIVSPASSTASLPVASSCCSGVQEDDFNAEKVAADVMRLLGDAHQSQADLAMIKRAFSDCICCYGGGDLEDASRCLSENVLTHFCT